MRKLMVCLIFLAAGLSCRPLLLDPLPRFMREQDRFARYAVAGEPAGKDSTTQDPGPVYVPSVYFTAIHFKDLVNWRTDSLLSAEVLFYKDGNLLLRQPVSSPPDPERLRIWDGHLWTDQTDGHQTVLSCDGIERFRYEGEELLRGFFIKNGDVHTLGQHPGEGFCYRINGEAVYSSPKGTLLGSPSSPEWRGGAFSPDGEDLYYCYSLPVQIKEGTRREYHVMKGDTPYRLIPAGTADAIYDLRVKDGRVYRLERRLSSLYLAEDDQAQLINAPAVSFVSGHLIPWSIGLTALGINRLSSASVRLWYFDPEQETSVSLSTGTSDKSRILMSGDRWLMADASADGLVLRLQFPDKESLFLKESFRCATPLCLFLSDREAAAALSHNTGNRHLLYHNGAPQSFSFNGYFTSVIVE